MDSTEMTRDIFRTLNPYRDAILNLVATHKNPFPNWKRFGPELWVGTKDFRNVILLPRKAGQGTGIPGLEIPVAEILEMVEKQLPISKILPPSVTRKFFNKFYAIHNFDVRFEAPGVHWLMSGSAENWAIFKKHAKPEEIKCAKIYISATSASDWARIYYETLNLYSTNEKEIRVIYANNLQIDIHGNETTEKAELALTRLLSKVISTDKSRRELLSSRLVALLSIEESPKPVVATAGIAFEKECLAILEKAGFSVSPTKASGDFGGDLIAEKDGLTYCIQCKAHAKPIGVKAVQEAAAARRYYKADYPVVVATSGFTSAAFELATELGVLFCDAQKLAVLDRLV